MTSKLPSISLSVLIWTVYVNIQHQNFPPFPSITSFGLWVFKSLLGAATKFFKYLSVPNLSTTHLVLLLDLRKYSAVDLYLPSGHMLTPFGPIAELHLEVSHCVRFPLLANILGSFLTLILGQISLLSPMPGSGHLLLCVVRYYLLWPCS